jgi:hypothetical protein
MSRLLKGAGTAWGALALCMLTGCGDLPGMLKFPKPDVSIAGVSMQDISFTSATMLFDVQIKNPYSAALPLVNMDYLLESGGTRFLKGAADVQGSVPAGETKTLPFPVEIRFLDVIDIVKGANPGSEIPYAAELGLSVDAPFYGRLRLPMRKEGTLGIPRPGSSWPFDFRTTRPSPDGF